MKINEVLIKEIPTYADPEKFYAGGKDLYQAFKNTFPKLPEKVADDIWHQKQPGTDPRVINQLKQGVPEEEAFITLMTGKEFLNDQGKDPLTNLTPEQLKKVLLEAIWAEKMLRVNPGSFTEHSRNKMIERNFGSASGEDPVRIKRAGMSNDPVTLIKSTQQGGYIMWEGWHRTMAKLKSGSDGTNNYANWEPVDLNAWVASV